MSERNIISGVIMDETTIVTFVEVCEKCEIPEDELREFIAYGIIEPRAKDAERITFDYYSLERVQSARRLKHDLGLNTPGIALALDLLDKLETMQDELDILRRHIDNP